MISQNKMKAAAYRAVMILALLLILPVSAQDSTTTGNPQTAEELYQEARRIAADVNATAEQIRSALQKVEQAVSLAPQSCKYPFGMGILFYRLKEWDNAETWFQKASQLQSEDCPVAKIDAWLSQTRQKQVENRNVLAMAGEITLRRNISLKDPDAAKEFDLQNEKPVMPVVRIGESDATLQEYFKSGFSGLNTLREDIFLLVGPYSEPELERHYQRGIKDFYQFLKHAYSFQSPGFVITVLVSDDPGKLIRISEKIFPQEGFPHYNPYFGFYSRVNHLVVATIGGGYGTLLHELMHVLVGADFPEAPLWLSEGMATLYERALWTHSKLKPLPNWRMDVLLYGSTPPLSHLDEVAKLDRIDRYDLGRIRLLLLFLDENNHLPHIYRQVKEAGDNFVLSQAVAALGPEYGEENWQAFVGRVKDDYRMELQVERNQPTYREVLFIQKALNRLISAGLTEDGLWGANTRKQLEEFQRHNGLEVNGVFNKETKELMEQKFALLNF